MPAGGIQAQGETLGHQDLIKLLPGDARLHADGQPVRVNFQHVLHLIKVDDEALLDGDDAAVAGRPLAARGDGDAFLIGPTDDFD
jgi:hypothetical protein